MTRLEDPPNHRGLLVSQRAVLNLLTEFSVAYRWKMIHRRHAFIVYQNIVVAYGEALQPLFDALKHADSSDSVQWENFQWLYKRFVHVDSYRLLQRLGW